MITVLNQAEGSLPMTSAATTISEIVNQIEILTPNVPGKPHRVGNQLLEGGNKRNGDSL
jgi:hypothetical protein